MREDHRSTWVTLPTGVMAILLTVALASTSHARQTINLGGAPATGSVKVSSGAPPTAQPGVPGVNTAQAARDPHPTEYSWSGEVSPAMDRSKFYTFFYTGSVTADAIVPAGARIQRIAVPNDEWSSIHAAMIDELAGFYEQVFNPSAQTIAVATGGQTEQIGEGSSFPTTGAQPIAAQPAQGNQQLDSRAAAEWMFYMDQVVLWQFYCKRVLLNVPGAERASSPAEQLERQRQMKALQERFPDTPPDQLRRLLDEENAVATGQQPAQPVGQAAAEPATVFDIERIWADPSMMDVYRDEFITEAKSLDERALGLYNSMLDRIDTERQAYEEFTAWLEQKRDELIAFALDWGQQQSGRRVTLGGTRFLLTQEVVDTRDTGSINVLIQDRPTPHDVLTRTGKVRRQGSVVGRGRLGGPPPGR